MAEYPLTEEMMSILNRIAAKTKSVITIRWPVDPKHPESGEQVFEFTKGFAIWNRTEQTTHTPEKDPRNWTTPENRHEPWPTAKTPETKTAWSGAEADERQRVLMDSSRRQEFVPVWSETEAAEGNRVLVNSSLRPELVPIWCYARQRVLVLNRELVIEVAQLRTTDPFYSPVRVLFDVCYEGGNCADWIVVSSADCLALIGENEDG